MEIGERKAIVSGVGQTQTGRRLFRDDLDLTVEACLAAVDDAGLTLEDIDGLCMYPGANLGGRARFSGFSGPGVYVVQDALRLRLNWVNAIGAEGPGQFGAIFNAIGWVAMGACRHVLVYRTVSEASQSAELRQRAASELSAAGGQHPAPLTSRWSGRTMNTVAAAYHRHMHEFGTTREMVGAMVINSRRNAGLHPNAVYREPLTMEEYLSARWISTPLGLYDCDVPCDGSTAFVISHVDTAADVRMPVAFQAVGSAIKGRPLWDQWEDFTTFSMRDAAAMMWSRTDLTTQDADLLELYDGFSFLTLAWTEALGFAERGEGGPFLASGDIARDGRYPLNTHGGQLSQGRLHGFGFLYEACVQLRGEAGVRQVKGPPEVAVVAAGGGPMCGCMIVTSHR